MNRVLTYLSPGELDWREMPKPMLLHPEDAIVRPVASSTCDLDIMIIQGRTPFKGPFDIGHECIGEIIEIGEGVRRFYPGQLVVVSWHISCGQCHRCRKGLMNTCASYPQGAMFGMSIGGKWGGFFSDFIRVPNADATLFVLPPGINPSHVASLSDNIPFGYELTVPHLTRNCGADVLIMGGTGSIGLFAAAYAKAGGAGSVDYVDTNKMRLGVAEKLGVNPIESPPKQRIGRRPGRYPITVDASGSSEGLLCAIRSTEPEGYCSSIGGHFGNIAFPMLEMYAKGLHFYTGRGLGRINFEAATDFIISGKVKPELIVTEERPFDEAAEVLRDPSMKPVLVRQSILSKTYQPKV
ncbi:alcohol dehydrogenase catalytic domain-containing protein [Leptospira noguchii]|uniref:Alcohol dehydrogenase, catalytic domain, GroES-like family n=1 Tax=Leptospira noguchii TaxID=28182 RepID=M6VD64_9LEPT|nr:alcohol dehydrogenase catalytic domain-containing protein [Leptospira noguchii]EMO55412.1 alcohol dehydrogenase, catalytic domain, GroES-like family [Leptospira noguchii]MCH1913134.1 alcohol dehydrogenase catalytic domain-containing protein [Leptospira noguchii]MCH1915615.1 alcohol dehydrogenase catalytic domain-containing protein [Leptospira noguchii]UOG65436.1 alcohol dehydrogenase catalytic domain-containing protein [Leptospira noguchii]